MFDRYCLGVDVSSWQATVHWEKLDENGVRFASIKASQGSYRQDPLGPSHLKAAQAAGMLCGVYHWMDPGCAVNAQISNLEHRLKGLDYAFLALDVEQYWSDWGEWQKGSISKRYPGKLISDCAQACADAMLSKFNKPVLIYTRASFVKEYAPQMVEWLPNWDLWLAHYPYHPGRIHLSWEQLKKHYVPSIPAPAVPEGSKNWRFWQFSGDKFILPGEQSALDLNFYHGSLQDLQAWLGQPQTPRSLSLEEKLDALWQAHPEIWQEVENV
jgi:GH25 family lysozyme M1 (1,4-beta-N-acetylmuramidase)